MRRLPVRWCVKVMFLAVAGFAGAATSAAQQPADTVGVRLDFQDVDLRLVISALAAAGDLNVIYGDLPTRRVTLRMSRPVAPDEIPALLRSLAASNGLDVIEEDGLVRVESRSAAGDEVTEEPEETGLRLFVYRLKHARAPVLSATLQSLFGGGVGPIDAQPGPRSLSERLREQRIPPFDPNAPPDVAVEMGATQAGTGLPGEVAGAVQIVPDENTNSLLVRAQPSDWEVIRQAIEALDLRPLQVLIEVMIAEVRRSSDLELGVSASTERPQSDRTRVEASLVGQSAGDLILEVMRSGRTTVNALIAALATEGNVRVVSRPVILAQNNQEARILIGDERPFIQVFRSLPTDAAVRDQVVQYRDVGTSLTITPTINSDGYVNLRIVQEVSTATSEEQFGAPVISTREAATQLFVRNEQTVVIGGLIDNQVTESESGVPLLKDIPILGHLFKSSSRSRSQNELFVFLTPRIVETDEDADRILEDLRHESELLRDTTMVNPSLNPRPRIR